MNPVIVSLIVSPSVLVNLDSFDELFYYMNDNFAGTFILDGSQDDVKKLVKQIVNNFDVNRRKKYQRLLQRLITNKKFVRTTFTANNLCELAKCITRTVEGQIVVYDLIISSKKKQFISQNALELKLACVNGCHLLEKGTRPSTLITPLTSGRINVRWTKKDLEERIFKPIFIISKKLEIVDRFLGSSISQGYSEMLDFILDCFQRFSYDPNEVKIHTRYEHPFSENEKTCLETQYNKNYSFQISILGYRSQIEHDRYLKTDQITLSLGAGFSLIYNSRVNNPSMYAIVENSVFTEVKHELRTIRRKESRY